MHRAARTRRSTLLWRRARPVVRRPVMPLLVASILLVGVSGRTNDNAEAAALPLSMGAPHAKSASQAAPKPEAPQFRQMDLQVRETPQPLAGHRVAGVPYRVSGYTPQAVSFVPFQRALFTEKVYPAKVDNKGAFVYELDGKRYYHPVATVQFALAELDRYFTSGRRFHLRRVIASAKVLIAHSVNSNGGMYFPYLFPDVKDASTGETITPPWWSAMAQGESLMLFTRLYQTTRNSHWLRAANEVFATLDDRGPLAKPHAPWTAYVDKDHYLWFEEYAGDIEPMLVLNGDIFAIFGLWDYYTQTHNEEARVLFDAAATTIREYLPGYRNPGDVAYYCLRAPLCQQPRWQNKKYHGIIIVQMRILADMTGDRWFDSEADRFASDYSG